jgi:phospholipid/cholesterol/gamma-HCH transport system ATP-binding protein
MIEVHNIRKAFGEQEVLRGIDAVFYPGKTNLIIGKSGSGKTVFLKCLLGLFNVDQGQILFSGADVSTLDREGRRNLRKEIGTVFQGAALFDSQTVEENVAFPLRVFTNQSPSEILDRVNFCLEKVNLPGSNAKYPAELSGGMKKRVAIARAIAMQPKYLFCDEPNSGLDPQTSAVIDDLIYDITAEFKMTTVVNTHDMNSVLEIGDHIVLLKNGLLSWSGNKEQVLETEHEDLVDFVFTSKLFREIKHKLK